MKLWINGQFRDTPELRTVAELAAWLQLPAFGSAVELNQSVVRRSDQEGTPLKDGDRLEIVRLVGGG